MRDEPSRVERVEDQTHKSRLAKSARLYAMCQKAELPDPGLQVSLALAAFEEMPLPEATAFVRTSKQSLEDMAWALRNSNSTEEFEGKLRERISTKNPRRRGSIKDGLSGQPSGDGNAR